MKLVAVKTLFIVLISLGSFAYADNTKPEQCLNDGDEHDPNNYWCKTKVDGNTVYYCKPNGVSGWEGELKAVKNYEQQGTGVHCEYENHVQWMFPGKEAIAYKEDNWKGSEPQICQPNDDKPCYFTWHW